MTEKQKGKRQHDELPTTHIDALTNSFSQFLRIETVSGAVLLLAAVVALTLSNSPWSDGFRSLWETPIGIRIGAFQFLRSLRDLINDGLMTLFFFIVALEIKREVVLGELRNPRMVALSVAAAAGGMLVPATVYLALQLGQPGQHGWGIVMPTDTAFVIGCLALLGSRVPPGLRVFLLSLAVVDDLAAILVVAVGYSRSIDWTVLALGVVGLAMIRGMALLGVRNIRAYFLAGAIIWLAVDASGIHATIVGVILGLMTPTAGWVSDQRLGDILRKVLSYPPGDHWSGDTEDNRALQVAAIAVRETLSPVERLEAMLHPWVAFGIMPLFALANAGVPISIKGLTNPVSLAVTAGFVLGKPIGVTGFAWLAVRTGIAIRPAGLTWSGLVGGALLTGIGFTMALFIAGQAFQDALLNEAKLGIFSASLVASVAGLTLLSTLPKRDKMVNLTGIKERGEPP